MALATISNNALRLRLVAPAGLNRGLAHVRVGPAGRGLGGVCGTQDQAPLLRGDGHQAEVLDAPPRDCVRARGGITHQHQTATQYPAYALKREYARVAAATQRGREAGACYRLVRSSAAVGIVLFMLMH